MGDGLDLLVKLYEKLIPEFVTLLLCPCQTDPKWLQMTATNVKRYSNPLSSQFVNFINTMFRKDILGFCWHLSPERLQSGRLICLFF